MNLWAFLLLGFLAQASHGCVQMSFLSIEKMVAAKFTDYLINLKDSPLPDITVNENSASPVTAKKVKVKSVHTITVNTKCSPEGKMIVDATWTVTVSSDSFPDTNFNMKLKMNILPFVQNKHFVCKSDPDSFEMTIELAENQDNVNITFKKKCKLSLITLFTGAVNCVPTSLTNQHADLIVPFKCKGFNCSYGVSSYSMQKTSFVANVILSCDGIGPLNDDTGVTVNTLKLDDESALYIEQRLVNNVFAIVPVDYKGTIRNAELNKAFPQCKGDATIWMKLNSPPKCSISADGATAKFSLNGNINDDSGNKLLGFDFQYWSAITMTVTSDFIKPSLGEATPGEAYLTSDNTNNDLNKSFEELKPVIINHIRQILKDFSCSLDIFRIPNPMGVAPKNAKCFPQRKQFFCVSKRIEC